MIKSVNLLIWRLALFLFLYTLSIIKIAELIIILINKNCFKNKSRPAFAKRMNSFRKFPYSKTPRPKSAVIPTYSIFKLR